MVRNSVASRTPCETSLEASLCSRRRPRSSATDTLSWPFLPTLNDSNEQALTVEEVSAIESISALFSALSVVGSGFIIYCYLRFTKLRKFAFKLVFILSINDFLNQVGDFIQPSSAEVVGAATSEPSTACYAQAWMDSYFELSSVLWTCSIAATLYMSVAQRKTIVQIEATFKWMCLICCGVPLVLTILPGLVGAYGHAGAWCWITEDFVAWRFMQFYVPTWAAVGFNAWIYYMVLQQVNRMARREIRTSAGTQAAKQDSQMLRVIRRLRFYPLILVVVWFWGTVNRLVEAFSGESVFWLFVLQKTFSSMQGMLNALAYGLTAGVRQEVSKILPNCCCADAGTFSEREGGARADTTVSGNSDEDEDETEAPRAAPGADDAEAGQGDAGGDATRV